MVNINTQYCIILIEVGSAPYTRVKKLLSGRGGTEYSGDLKSPALMDCGFESHRPDQ